LVHYFTKNWNLNKTFKETVSPDFDQRANKILLTEAKLQGFEVEIEI